MSESSYNALKKSPRKQKWENIIMLASLSKLLMQKRAQLSLPKRAEKKKNEGVMYKVLPLIGLTDTLTNTFLFLL